MSQLRACPYAMLIIFWVPITAYRALCPRSCWSRWSLGLSNFAAAIGIGVSGVDTRTRLRAGLVFGLFEAAMPLLGLRLGHGLAHALGHAARWTAPRS